MNLHTVFLGLGSNLGERAEHLATALRKITSFSVIERKSGIYETEPWGLKEQPTFLNQVVQIQTAIEPGKLLLELKKIEKQMGRKKTVRFGPRLIDLDILFYDDLILRTERLSIPHPSLTQRAFLLVPLNEIAPEFVHPVEKKTIQDLLLKVDRHGIRQWEENQ
jgi:2-amino-4-hydroxy-6-hydroxymethyldihydropteridine diphosphokinase